MNREGGGGAIHEAVRKESAGALLGARRAKPAPGSARTAEDRRIALCPPDSSGPGACGGTCRAGVNGRPVIKRGWWDVVDLV